MNTPSPYPLLALIAALLASSACLAEPPELLVLRQQYEQLLDDQVNATHEAGVRQLNAHYLEAVDRSITTAKTSGDLAAVLALDEEKKTITAGHTLPDDDDQTPVAILKLRTVYRAALEKLDAQSISNRSVILSPYIGRLKQLEATLTKADKRPVLYPRNPSQGLRDFCCCSSRLGQWMEGRTD